MPDHYLKYQIINNISDIAYSFLLESDIAELFEIISRRKADHHLKTSRIGLGARRVARLVLLGSIPVVNLWALLADAGVVSMTEKHTFIRFQGLTDVHIKRIVKSTSDRYYRNELENIQDDFSNASKDEFEDAYFELVSREAALVVSGYVAISDGPKMNSKEIEDVAKNITNFRFSLTPNTGLMNRFKSMMGSLVGFSTVGLVTAVFPLASYLGHFNILAKRNVVGRLKHQAADHLVEYLKRIN